MSIYKKGAIITPPFVCVSKSRVSGKVYNERFVFVSVCHESESGFVIGACADNKERSRLCTERGEMTIGNLLSSCRRSYRECCRRALAIGVDRMLTLTFARNVDTSMKGVAYKVFAAFIRKCRKAFGSFEYVAVPELQKRGAIHFHLGLTRWYAVDKLWSLWKDCIIAAGLAVSADKVGSVYINKKSRAAGKSGYDGVARYIAKYIMKASNDLSSVSSFNGKRYFASRMVIAKIDALIVNGVVALDDMTTVAKNHVVSLFSNKRVVLCSAHELKEELLGCLVQIFCFRLDRKNVET